MQTDCRFHDSTNEGTIMNAYRIIRVADSRSRGACAWYEIEGSDTAGRRWHVATHDTREEAREMLKAIREQIDNSNRKADR